MLCPVHMSSREHFPLLTMAPRTRNKKPNKQIKLPTHAGDNNYGRPPGTATRRAGPSRAPTRALSEHDHTPHHRNDGGAPTLMPTADAHQVDHNPPRFELIQSDDESEALATSREESELGESPPITDATPTTSRKEITEGSPTAPTVTTTYTNDEIFTKLYENILVGMNAAFEKNRKHEMEKLCLMLGSLEQLTQGTQEHQQVLVRKLDEMGTKISLTIVSELTGMRADIDHMNMLHKVSTDIFLAQLHSRDVHLHLPSYWPKCWYRILLPHGYGLCRASPHHRGKPRTSTTWRCPLYTHQYCGVATTIAPLYPSLLAGAPTGSQPPG